MKPSKPFVWLLIAWLIAWLIGCQSLTDLRFQSPEKDADEEAAEEQAPKEFGTKVETPLVGEYTTFAGLNPVMIEGVGLVTGLRGTGGDPQVSMYRTALLNDMRKRGVSNPETWMQSPNTALVIVRAYLPPLLEKGESFDIEVIAPESSGATSLAGGWLLETYLRDHAVVPGGKLLEGSEYGTAKGPILVSALDTGSDQSAGSLLRGRILGGGMVKKERELALYLRNDYRSGRNAKRIADAIGRRFNYYNEHGLKRPLAEAKNDQKIVLQLPEVYKNNYPHFLQVCRKVAFREDAVARRVRIQSLRRELDIPDKAEQAALQLEAVGDEAIPVLKAGLKADTLECRFYAARGLAYLGDPSGLESLAEAAREEPAFRVFALTAMSAIDDAECQMLLRDLMNESSAETRYGAFRAVWTIDKDEPFIRGEDMQGHFQLHVLQTKGEPMIHLTRHQRPEVVLFGADQRFHVPLFLQAGKDLMVTAQAGNDTVSVTRFDLQGRDQKRVVSTKVADVIRACSELGASYPDVAQLLVQASKQHNAPGPVAMDALPRPGREYLRPREDGGHGDKTRVGNSGLLPNIFSGADEEEQPDDLPSLEEEEPTADGRSGSATMVDDRTAKAGTESKPGKGSDSKKKRDRLNPFYLPPKAAKPDANNEE